MNQKEISDHAHALVLDGDRWYRERDLTRARSCWQRAAELLLPLIDAAEPLPQRDYESASVSQWRLAVLAERERDHRLAASLYSRALEIDEHGLPTSNTTAYLARSAGRNYGSSGEQELWLTYAKRAAELHRAIDPASRGLAIDLIDVGQAHLARQEWDDAINSFEAALQICSDVDPESDEAAAALNNLGQAHWGRGDAQRGLEYHLQALTIDRKLDPSSSETATSLNNVGLMYKMLGHLEEAREYYERALELDQTRDPGSVATARDLQNLGKIHQAFAELLARDGSASAEDARYLEQRYMREALEITQRRAPGSMDHAQTLNALGDALFAVGAVGGASDYYREAQQITSRVGRGSQLSDAIEKNLARVAQHRTGA